MGNESKSERITPEDLATTQRVLSSVGAEHVLHTEPEVGDLIDAKARLLQIEPVVQAYHEREQELQTQINNLQRRLARYEGEKYESRRTFLRRARNIALVGILATAGSYTGKLVFDANFSDEATQKKVAHDRAEQAIYEKNNRLGADPSIASMNGWTINHPTLDQNTKYASIASFKYPAGYAVLIPTGSMDQTGKMTVEDTAISLIDYTKLNGVHIPEFKIEYEHQKFKGYLQGDASLENIDYSKVQFTNINNNTTFYLSFNRIDASPAQFQIDIAQRITR